jgi:hypothetical protein
MQDHEFLTGRFGICVHPIATNCIAVEVGLLTVYFSYRTPIGYRWKGKAKHICENIWGETTEKHMDIIGAMGSRDTNKDIKRNDFETNLKAAFRQNFIVCANNLLRHRFGIEEKEVETSEAEPSDGIRKDLENA